ncbi:MULTISPECIES: hypothetical protein [Rhodococcus]|uniref:hypothetical protein n=1 Tax=Rhodococcus TaxID=1827 RepID=UPI001E63DD5F|nr:MULTISPECIES: hypothetical protein [Rhodococcus]
MAIALDVLVLVPFVMMKARSDWFTVAITTAVAAVIIAAQAVNARRHPHDDPGQNSSATSEAS